MEFNKVPVGGKIRIARPTTTAWSRPSKTENIGDVNQGEEYVVHKKHEESGLIELDQPAAGWPASLHPLSYGGVWIDPRFVELAGTPDPEPEPEPEPIPEPGDGSLKSLAAKLGQALLDWSLE